MANPIPVQLSPGVKVSEIDLSQFVQPESINSAGMVGVFNWGPSLLPTRVTSESNLAAIFGKPTLDSSDKGSETEFFSAANFLKYSNNLKVIRLHKAGVAGDINASTSDIGIATTEELDNLSIKTLEEFTELGGFSGADGIESLAHFRARYPGNFGNSLKVIVNDGTGTQVVESTTSTLVYKDYVLEGGFNLTNTLGISSGTIGYTFEAKGPSQQSGGGGGGKGEFDLGGGTDGSVFGTEKSFGVTSGQVNWYMVTLAAPKGSQTSFINDIVKNMRVIYATGTTTANFNLCNSGKNFNPEGNAENYFFLERKNNPGVPYNPFTFNPQTDSIFIKSSGAQQVSIIFLDGDSTNMNGAWKVGGKVGTETIAKIEFKGVSGIPSPFSDNGGKLIFQNASKPNEPFDLYRSNWSNMVPQIGSVNGSVKGWAQLVALTGGQEFQKTTNGVVGTIGVTFDTVGGLTGVLRDFTFGLKQFGTVATETKTSTTTITSEVSTTTVFDKTPTTSQYAADFGGSNDELSFAVIDTGGKFGPKNGILEKFELLSKAVDAVDIEGNSIYYKDYINTNSQYVYMTKPFGYTGGGNASSVATTAFGNIYTEYLEGGVTLDRVGFYESQMDFGQSAVADPSFSDYVAAYSKFVDDENAVDMIFIPESTTTNDISTNATTIEQYVYDTVIEPRKDTLLILPTPKPANPFQFSSQIATNLVNFRNNVLSVPSNSYTMLVGGRKVFFDTYNNQTRKMSLSSDLAGLLSAQEIPWESPAGFARGMLKNVIKLETKFSKPDRDELYKNQINFFVEFNDGSGTVLFGDKTLLVKPSAFDRINVRRVFIAAEKAIAKAAKYSLFEFNDEFTRSQFRNLVNPFLANLQAQRGIADFKVVCDETNNTAEVIDKNQFVADIYIKPLKSINFIQLNFIAVRSDFNLTTIE